MFFQKLFKSKRRIKKSKLYKKPVSDFYNERILEQLDVFEFKHPNKKQWLSHEIFRLFKQKLSTGKIEFLEKIYDVCEDDFTRKLVARRIYLLRQGYLKSHKEYSDRRLIMFAEREKFADKWEGIYLLGEFGKDNSRQYLVEKIKTETDATLKKTMQTAILKIKRNAAKKRKVRGGI